MYNFVVIVAKKVDGWVDIASHTKNGPNLMVIGSKLSVFCLLWPLIVFINPFFDYHQYFIHQWSKRPGTGSQRVEVGSLREEIGSLREDFGS
jgi:hypothetical protein